MIITDYKLHTRDELFNIIKQTHLAGNSDVHPFTKSNLSIQNMTWRDLMPTQTFVLQEQLDNISNIRTQMLTYGIDVMKLDGFLSYKTDTTTSQFVFTPPIIEVIDGTPLIIDGQHRIMFSRENNMPLNVLIIENIDKSVWPYQLPLKDGWNGVQRFQSRLPDSFIRKERRYPKGEHKYYFREYPFNGLIKLAREHTGR